MVKKKLEEKIKQIIRKMLEDILEDEYLSHLFPTFLNLIDVEQNIVDVFSKELLPAIKERNTRRIQIIAIKIAKRHKELNIPIYEFHKYFYLFYESLKNFLSSQENYQILTFQDLAFFKETFLRYYALGYMDYTIAAGKDLIVYLKHYFNLPTLIELLNDFHNLIKNLEQNKSLLEKEKIEILTEFLFFNEKKLYFPCLQNQLELSIKSYNIPEYKLLLENYIQRFHTTAYALFRKIYNRKFIDASLLAEEIITDVFNILLLIKGLELNWEINKRRNILRFLQNPNNLLEKIILILSKDNKIRHKLLMDLRKKIIYRQDFKNFFLTDLANFIVIFSRQGWKANILLNDLKELDNKFALVGKQEIKIGIASPGLFSQLSEEEISELFNEIENTLNSYEEGKIFYIDLIRNKLISKVKELTSLKHYIVCSIKNKVNFRLYYQPIVDLNNQTIYGVEILTRLIDKNGKSIEASKFIKIVKEKKLHKQFDLLVLELIQNNARVLSQITNRVFINIFPSSLADEEVVKSLLNTVDILSKNNIKPVIEITEYEILVNTDFLNFVDNKKLEIAIDDFGSGYSNFRTVSELIKKEKIHYLKVDGDLIKDIISLQELKAVVKTIAEFAKNLNCKLVFEHISNKEIYQELLKIMKKVNLSFAFGQGYYLGKPQPLKKEENVKESKACINEQR